jgi:hypothetical protein
MADTAGDRRREEHNEHDRCQPGHADANTLHALSAFIGRQSIGGSRFNHWSQI